MTFSWLPIVLATPLLVGSVPPPVDTPQTPKPTASSAKATPKAAPKGAARTIEITGGDDMKFNLTTIAVTPGESVRIVLKVVGTMPKIAMAHNVVVLTAGSDPVAFSNAAMMARATDFIPADKKAQVLAATGLAGPGETIEVTFKAPAKPGSYDYLCSFPGHFAAGMRGKMVVK